MVSYFSLLSSLMAIFTVITVLHIPAFAFYSNGASNLSSYAAYSLGNMGYSSSVCNSVVKSTPQLYMKCTVGTLHSVESVGVVPNVEHAVKSTCYYDKDTDQGALIGSCYNVFNK